jgi:hypothetical protein
MNMAYCRFENTLRDLQDCAEHIHDKDLSPTEEEARRRLLKTCLSLADYADPWDDGENTDGR